MKRIIITLAMSAVSANCQPAGSGRPEFEVASIKRSAPGKHTFSVRAEHGQLTAAGASLQSLIQAAYQIKGYQISGGPAWLDSDYFDIVAKASPGRGANFNQLMAMLQVLLADRFKLAVHRQPKDLQGYALVVAKTGSKLHLATVEEETGVSKPLLTGRRGNVSADRITLAQVAMFLAGELGAPVVDATGLQGVFQLRLEWAPEGRPPLHKLEGGGDGADPNAAEPPGIFTALPAQLGLKLEARKVPVEVIVIDHVERVPTEN